MGFRLDKISKSYGDIHILKNLSLSFPVGKISCLMGPSGIGKTTILNIIADCTAPDAGKVISDFHGQLSYLFQESLLLPWLTVMENICYLMGNDKNRTPKEEEALELLSLMELSGCQNHYPTELSGGMARRVALARALACPAPLLLMDEPFTGLDNELKIRIADVVRNHIRLQQRTALIVTHDMEIASKIADHLFYCKKGNEGLLVEPETNIQKTKKSHSLGLYA